MITYFIEQAIGLIICCSLTLSFVFYIRFKWNQADNTNLVSLFKIITKNTVSICSIFLMFTFYFNSLNLKLEKRYNSSIVSLITNSLKQKNIQVKIDQKNAIIISDDLDFNLVDKYSLTKKERTSL